MTTQSRANLVKKSNTIWLWRSCVAASVLAVVACATEPPPSHAIQAAEQAIATAEHTRVADYASPELTEAREKLMAAHRAVQDEKMVEALHLAEQSRIDAELAMAKAEAAKARVVNDEMMQGTSTLKQEMRRNVAPK